VESADMVGPASDMAEAPDTAAQVLDTVESTGETASRGRSHLFDRPRLQCQDQWVPPVRFQACSWGRTLSVQIPPKIAAE
jgi:hypothetical protein